MKNGGAWSSCSPLLGDSRFTSPELTDQVGREGFDQSRRVILSTTWSLVRLPEGCSSKKARAILELASVTWSTIQAARAIGESSKAWPIVWRQASRDERREFTLA